MANRDIAQSPLILSAYSCCIVVLLLFCIPISGYAQNPILPEKKAPPAPDQHLKLPSDDATIQSVVEQLEARLKNLRTGEFTATELTPEVSGLPVASPDELRKRRLLVSELIIVLDAHAESLRNLMTVRKTNRDRTAEITEWEGFTEKPPFPITFLDELRDAAASQKNDILTAQMRLSVITGDLNRYIKALRASRSEMRLQDELFEKSAGTAKEGRQRWLRDMVRLRNELNEAAIASFETQRLVTEEILSGKKDYLGFLEQKLQAALRVSPLTKADVDLKLQTLDVRKRQIVAELNQAQKLEAASSREAAQYRIRIDEIQARMSQGDPSPSLQAELKRIQSVLDLKTRIADGDRERVVILKGLTRLNDYAQTIWEDRLWLNQNPSMDEIRSKADEMRTVIDNLELWKSFILSRMFALTSLMQPLRSQVETPEQPAGTHRDKRLILKSYENRHALQQKAIEQIAEVSRLAGHFAGELASRRDSSSIGNRLRDFGDTVFSFTKKIWLAELYVAEETVVVEGAKVVKPVSVTVAKAVQALIILVVGVWIARKLMRPLRWLVVHKFNQNRNTASQIGTVAFLVMFVAVFVFSLVSVNIPLAIFAFFGGALAIGVGFGAQNLISNFISGLILLFDRSISVGDLIEVDGQSGKVTAIGMRSSLVQRFDGVEMLVPNSQFLQQKVINWTHSERQMRYSIAVGVAYGSPVRKVSELLMQAVSEQDAVLAAPAPMALLEDFADSSLNFSVYFWLQLDSVRDNRILISTIRIRIIELLEAHGIVIPFPQRDLHLDTSAPLQVNVVAPSSRSAASSEKNS